MKKMFFNKMARNLFRKSTPGFYSINNAKLSHTFFDKGFPQEIKSMFKERFDNIEYHFGHLEFHDEHLEKEKTKLYEDICKKMIDYMQKGDKYREVANYDPETAFEYYQSAAEYANLIITNFQGKSFSKATLADIYAKYADLWRLCYPEEEEKMEMFTRKALELDSHNKLANELMFGMHFDEMVDKPSM